MQGFSSIVILTPYISTLKVWVVLCFVKDFLFKSILTCCDFFLLFFQEILDQIDLEVQEKGSLRYIISTKVGSGPQVLKATSTDDPVHLLNPEGLPRTKTEW